MDKEQIHQERRGFLKQFGATLGAAGLGAAGLGSAHAAVQPKGKIPDRPVKVGHITFLTGPAELLGGPGQRGHVLAHE
ncbi:MAG: twin-arginine translocation signal domain-containing protein, partial [Gemmatimonadetes bacterium]|nr:twin-arginine translocation signal domain-containing protein [Gemmatimonadota bacterium]